jgi:AcrR family transcriptional regulator
MPHSRGISLVHLWADLWRAESSASAESREEMRRAVWGLYDQGCLTPREQKVCRARLGLKGGIPESRAAVAADFGISVWRIRRIEERALRKLRRSLQRTLAADSVSEGDASVAVAAPDDPATAGRAQVDGGSGREWTVRPGQARVARERVVGGIDRFDVLLSVWIAQGMLS